MFTFLMVKKIKHLYWFEYFDRSDDSEIKQTK